MMVKPTPQAYEDSSYYLNRELSLLSFNLRIFELALDQRLPLLERLKFLFICCDNLDEFFEIRVAQLKEQVALGRLAPGKDGLSPDDTLRLISETLHPLVEQQYQLFNNTFIPELKSQGIEILKASEWTDEQKAWLRHFFKQEIQPIITPIGLDLSHPFPRLINKSLNFIIALEGIDAFGRDSGLGIIHAPKGLPRLLKMPQALHPKDGIALLADIFEFFMPELFPGMNVKGCYQFRLTRNSDVFLAADGIEDLPQALKGELFSRRYGRAVRLEISSDCPDNLVKFLLKKFQLDDKEVYKIQGPVNLSRLMPLTELEGHSNLKFEAFTPGRPKGLPEKPNLFKIMDEQDLLLHHPFQSFGPIIDFVEQAAKDPDVLAIKQTLYRTGIESSNVQALIEAARQGKEVTAVIELRARFDEAANIDLANRLQEAGALVVYGILDYKTHAKMTLVIRKHGKKLKHYAHLGTGNYHNENAKIYTDYSLLTADHAICDDVHKLFLQLTGLGKAYRLKKLLHAPFTLQKKLIELIENEANNASQNKPARIMAKINALTDPQIIQALYAASSAGVKIELIVRGMCCLKPGLPGVSENIKVRSCVGRFLEHSRIYYFENDQDPILYCASADWMERNFHYRVEVAFPILDKKLAEQVKKDGLLNYLSDNYFCWTLDKDGNFNRLNPSNPENSKMAQDLLLKKFKG